MLDYISDPKCFYIKVKDTYVLKSDIDKAIKDKKEKVIKVKAIDGNEISIKVNEVNKLSSPNNIYVRIKDNKENKDYFVNQRKSKRKLIKKYKKDNKRREDSDKALVLKCMVSITKKKPMSQESFLNQMLKRKQLNLNACRVSFLIH